MMKLNQRILGLVLALIVLVCAMPVGLAEGEANLKQDVLVLFTSDVHCGVDEPKNLPASVIQSITGRQWILSMF